MQFSDEFAFPKIETPKETFYFNFQNTVSNIKEENNHFGFSQEQNPFEIKLDVNEFQNTNSYFKSDFASSFLKQIHLIFRKSIQTQRKK